MISEEVIDYSKSIIPTLDSSVYSNRLQNLLHSDSDTDHVPGLFAA